MVKSGEVSTNHKAITALYLSPPVNRFLTIFPHNISMLSDTPSDFARQLQNYRLTTAEIIYGMPDYPRLLQSYIWQELDIAPRFPVLHKFLHFWETKLEGKLYMVKVAHEELIKPGEFTYCDGEFVLH